MIAAGIPDRGAKPQFSNSSRGHVDTMVEFRGFLPAKPAEFLNGLSPNARRHVFTLLGVFKEVRDLVDAGRLLHAYLSVSADATFHSRITGQEFTQEKGEILQAISALRRKINRAAQEACLILPRNHQLRMEEMSRENAAYVRVS
jgi:hypothetical protein